MRFLDWNSVCFTILAMCLKDFVEYNYENHSFAVVNKLCLLEKFNGFIDFACKNMSKLRMLFLKRCFIQVQIPNRITFWHRRKNN